jgi:pyruvate,water dikinase
MQIVEFNHIRDKFGVNSLNFVGGKNASLGNMITDMDKLGIKVPNGFAITTSFYNKFMKDNDILKLVNKLDSLNDHQQIEKVALEIRNTILESNFDSNFISELKLNYLNIGGNDVAVRSSATAEDLDNASFAGQQDTYLNVNGIESLIYHIKKCIASLFNFRAISYRNNFNIKSKDVGISVGVQKMVRSDIGSAGVAFSIDPDSGNNKVVVINSAHGLGEIVVSGQVIPDEFIVTKDINGISSIIDKKLGNKENKLIYGDEGIKMVKNNKINSFSLENKDILILASWVRKLEKYMSKEKYQPVDIEWAYDGIEKQLYIVQCRPETVHSNVDHDLIVKYKVSKNMSKNELNERTLLKGISVGSLLGLGKVRKITFENNEAPENLSLLEFDEGDILVTEITDPDWEPIMKKASAIITEKGGRTCHAAIVARELQVPCCVGAIGCLDVLKTGQEVTLDCTQGEEAFIYDGLVEFEKEENRLSELPKPPIDIMLNVAAPQRAFQYANIPNKGVGLVREEFIINNFIQVHPLALINYNNLHDDIVRTKIEEITRGYDNKVEYFIDKLTYGLARIATAFYPNNVIIRFSDFKSNEYANLLGGQYYEPHEENPMIGWRGASRYYSEKYEQAFGLECEAIKRIRNNMGLTNVIVMIPFCRTPKECQRVLATMEKFGLKRGENGLQVYIMCEVPSNVILAEEFCKYVDGFSIGSNDLTQLTLGLDRDSELVQHLYEERNEAVKMMISQAIKICKKNNVKIGICGQAPSDFPDFAQFLIEEGIDTISLTPDSVVKTIKKLTK